MKPKILLVNPWYEYNPDKPNRYSRAWQPIDLAIAGALLEEKGYEIRIMDINALKIPIEEAIKQSKGFGKIFIASASLDRWQCPHIDIDSFLLTVVEFRKSFPKSKIFVFGPHCTMRPKEMLEKTKADALIIGEPELAIVDLCEKNDLSKVKGIAYKKNIKINKVFLSKTTPLKVLPGYF